jgi:hypothetical protein
MPKQIVMILLCIPRIDFGKLEPDLRPIMEIGNKSLANGDPKQENVNSPYIYFFCAVMS